MGQWGERGFSRVGVLWKLRVWDKAAAVEYWVDVPFPAQGQHRQAFWALVALTPKQRKQWRHLGMGEN